MYFRVHRDHEGVLRVVAGVVTRDYSLGLQRDNGGPYQGWDILGNLEAEGFGVSSVGFRASGNWGLGDLGLRASEGHPHLQSSHHNVETCLLYPDSRPYHRLMLCAGSAQPAWMQKVSWFL